MSIDIQVHHSGTVRKCNTRRMKQAILAIANDYGWEKGEISIALLSDLEIREINRQHLSHDYPTDVISFDLTEGEDHLEGEILTSVETADREAVEQRCSPDDELLLYIIHGMLHIIGLGDKSTAEIRAMRAAELHYMQRLGAGGTE